MPRHSSNPDSFGFLVTDIARLYRAEIDRGISEAGLEITPAEARTLVHAARSGPVRQSVLAERMGIEAMTLSTYLDRLEKYGMVERVVDPEDRRAKQVRLTDAADAVLSEIDRISSAARKHTASKFSQADWDQLNGQLKDIRDHLASARN